jgi:hypothetical protein
VGLEYAATIASIGEYAEASCLFATPFRACNHVRLMRTAQCALIRRSSEPARSVFGRLLDTNQLSLSPQLTKAA